MSEAFDKAKFLKKFYEFAATVTINTKELGKVVMKKENLLGTQTYFVEEVADGLEQGIHDFVVLKGRQVAITTICLLLDMFWLGRHKGLTGSFVTQDEPARDMFRVTFDQIAESTRAPFKIMFKIHNRTQLLTAQNDNRMLYQVAGTRKNSGLGKGSAITFAHMTEVSEYGDEEGLASLMAAFAQENPNRLFIQESTAQGYNHYYQTCINAQNSSTTKFIFVGWWRNHFYTKKKGSKEYEVYWDGKLSPEEKKWTREVEKLYGFVITDEQIAWWRWQLAEKQKDEQLMMQNFPPTEHYAFVKSGSQFFSGARINDEYKLAIKNTPKHYKFVFNANFEDTELIESSDRNGNLKVWEPPQPGAYYAIGADPAWGSSEWKDGFVAQVYRCYADGMEQVAEFHTTDCDVYRFAWTICYLGGAYLDQPKSVCILNLELNGPGVAVWQEVQGLPTRAAMSRTEAGKKIFKIVSRLGNYMYKRPDSFGSPSAYHTVSTTRIKELMLNNFRDGFERNIIKVNSKECIDEMRRVVRDEDFIGAPDREKDDRVLGSALATTVWVESLRNRLITACPGGLTREASKRQEAQAGTWQPTNVSKFIQQRMGS